MTAEALKPGVVLVARYRIDQVDAVQLAYQATDLSTGEAVELISVDEREAEALQSVVGFHGPDLLELIDVVRLADQQLAVCTIASGATLSDLVSERGSMGAAEGVRLLMPVATSLAHLHRSNAIHGSVTPQTILIGNRSRLGFRPGRAGVSAFRCPERNAGGGPSARDDAWALAACLYYVMVGEPPARSGIGAPDELFLAGINDQQLRTILFQGLATARVQRVASAEPLRAALERWLKADGEEPSASPFGGRLTAQQATPSQRPSHAPSVATAATERAPDPAPGLISGRNRTPGTSPGVRLHGPASTPPVSGPPRDPNAATLESPAYTPAPPSAGPPPSAPPASLPERRPDSVRPPMLSSPGVAPGSLPPRAQVPRSPPSSRGATLESPAAPPRPGLPPPARPPRADLGSTAPLATDGSARSHGPASAAAPAPRKFGGTLALSGVPVGSGARSASPLAPAPAPRARSAPPPAPAPSARSAPPPAGPASAHPRDFTRPYDADDATVRADLSSLLRQAGAPGFSSDADIEDETAVLSPGNLGQTMRLDADATNRLPPKPSARPVAPASPIPASAPAPVSARPAAVPSAAQAAPVAGLGSTAIMPTPSAKVAADLALGLAMTQPAAPAVAYPPISSADMDGSTGGGLGKPGASLSEAPAPARAGAGLGRWVVMAVGLSALAAALVAAFVVYTRNQDSGAEPLASGQPGSGSPAALVSAPAKLGGAERKPSPAEPAPSMATADLSVADLGAAPEGSAAAVPTAAPKAGGARKPEPQSEEPQAKVRPAKAAPTEPKSAPAPKAAGDEPSGKQATSGSAASGGVAECVARWMPEGTFRKPPSVAWMCGQTDARKGALDFKKAVILGAGGKLTPAMRIYSRLGWYELAAYATLRDACCEAPEPIFLPESDSACSSMPEVIAKLSAEVRSTGSGGSALAAFAKNAQCEASAGRAGAYWMKRSPGGQERATFEAWVAALRR